MPTFEEIALQLAHQAIEVPSWAYGNSGTRFKVFGSPGTPRNVEEKIADAATVHRFTGLAPKVALHIPWDMVDDFGALTRYAADQGIDIGTINSNTFQDEDYKFGGLTHHDPVIRQKAIDHHLQCLEIMGDTGSSDLKIWLADGSNYPGQADIRNRQDRLADSLKRSTPSSARTNGLCWSTRSLSLRSTTPTYLTGELLWSRFRHWGSGPGLPRHGPPCAHHKCGVHRRSTAEGSKLGSFDFNSRNYADDDLIVGSADPFQLFRILFEVIRGGGYEPDSGVAFMLDQCHNIEKKIPGQIRSVLNVQEMTARALLVDREALAEAQTAGDVLGAHQVFMDAFYTDVRPDLASWRESRGLPGDPMAAYAESGYPKIEADRVGGSQMSW